MEKNDLHEHLHQFIKEVGPEIERLNLNIFDILFLNYLYNPNSGIACKTTLVKPDRGKGWLRSQLSTAMLRSEPLTLQGDLGEVKLSLGEHFEYDNADVFKVDNEYSHAFGEMDFLVIDKGEQVLGATLLSLTQTQRSEAPQPRTDRVDANPKFL